MYVGVVDVISWFIMTWVMSLTWCCMWGGLQGFVFFFKQKTAYEMRISDWSSDVCSSDLLYAVVIFLGSIHLGWHYAVDGYVSIVAVAAIWAEIGRASCRDRVCQYV